MPTVAKAFILDNRVLQPGEAFEPPPGVALEALRAEGLVEAEEAEAAVPQLEPAPPLELPPDLGAAPKRRRKRAAADPSTA